LYFSLYYTIVNENNLEVDINGISISFNPLEPTKLRLIKYFIKARKFFKDYK